MMADSGTGVGPRDASVMEAILREMGVEEYEPNVIHQMLEFSYRYITGVLEDARVYSEHAQKKELDVADVRLAVQTRMDHSFTTPPPRDFLIDIARQKNSTPLPLIPEKFGPRLPPERYCLTFNNYKMKDRKKQQLSLSKPQVTLSATFRLPISKQTTTTAATVQSVSSLKSQLSSPLLQAVSAISPSPLSTPTPSLNSSSQQQSLSTLSSSAAQVQSSQSGDLLSSSASDGGGGQSAPPLPLGSLGTSGSLVGAGDVSSGTSSGGSAATTTPVLSMPLLGKMQ